MKPVEEATHVYLTGREIGEEALFIMTALINKDFVDGEIELITAAAHDLAIQASILHVLKGKPK